MACNNCNKVDVSCSCDDVAYSHPCTYTNCGVGNERCDDVQCTECVSYCGSSFQIESPSGILKVETGERLDYIIQKMALMIAKGLGNCTANNVHHAPYNVYAQAITDVSIHVVWDGISSLSSGLNVYYDTVTSPSGWTLANSTPLMSGVSDFNVQLLNPDTEYKIKLTSTDGSSTCDSVEILVTTLA